MLPYFKKLFGREVSVRAGAMLGIVLMGLFGLMEAGAWELHHVRLKSLRQHAIPRVREETSRELRLLTRAIDDYKNRLGCYPPDHQLSQNPIVVDATTNQLLYELLGTVYDSTNDTFSPRGHFPGIRGNLVKKYFNVGSFKNSAEQPDMVKQFIQSTDIPGTYGVSEKPEVGVLAFFPNWEGIDPELLQEFSLAPWQYNCSAPVHNPKSYDLWIEIPLSNSKIVVGNW
jgi:hypothetical protein